MIKEKPILFSTPMIRAILEGRKTQTRRINQLIDFDISHTPGYEYNFRDKGTYCWNDVSKERLLEKYCPYKTGQTLWVRETWKIVGWNDNGFKIQYKDGKKIWYPEPCDGDWAIDKMQQCTDECLKAGLQTGENGNFIINGETPTRWRPGIFMPRWASRISLKITNIRVERVQEIKNEDAIKEGALYHDNGKDAIGQQDRGWSMFPENIEFPEKCFFTAKYAFANLWDKLNNKCGFGWGSDPWVWVIEFERIKGEDNK